MLRFSMFLICISAVQPGWLSVGVSGLLKCLNLSSITAPAMCYIRCIRSVILEQMNEEFICGCRAGGLK